MILDLADPVARAIAVALGFGILEATALALLVLLIARLSHPSATTRHVLWWIAFAAGTALPIVSITTSLGRIEHRAAAPLAGASHRAAPKNLASGTASTTARVWTPAEMAAAGGSGPALAAPAPLEQAMSASAKTIAFVLAVPHLAAALVAVWLAGSLVGLAQLARSLLSLAAIKRAALPLDESVVKRLRRWRHSTKLGREVTLRVSNDVDVPVAVGFRTPTILLPARVVEIEEIADLDQIAMHEYAHLNRYDDWTNLLQRLVERIFWFNPIVMLVGRQISLEREIACDDWVIAQTGRAHRYATCLWKLVESARLPANAIMAPGALLSPKQITTRIEQLLDSRRNALPRLSPIGAIALGSLGVALIVLQAQRAPVIAIEDVAPVPAVAAVPPAPAAPKVATVPPALAAPKAAAAPRAVAAARAVAAPLAAPAIPAQPARVAMSEADATPAAIATALAADLAKRNQEVIKASIEASLSRHIRESVNAAERAQVANAKAQAVAAGAEAGAVAGAGAGVTLGVNIAKHVAESVSKALADENGLDEHDDESDNIDPKNLTRDTISRCFGCELRGRDLRGLDLHGIALNGADLRGADLRGVDLRGSKLFGVDLRNAKLDGANLSNAAVSGCDLRGATLEKANLDGLRLTGTSIRGATLGGNRLRSLINGCMGCDLRGIDLHAQDLHEIELDGADLREADLHDADLHGAHLRGVDLRGARVDGADLSNAEMTGCDLRGVDLNSAHTHGLSTAYAEFEGLAARYAPLDAKFQRITDEMSLRASGFHRAMAP